MNHHISSGSIWCRKSSFSGTRQHRGQAQPSHFFSLASPLSSSAEVSSPRPLIWPLQGSADDDPGTSTATLRLFFPCFSLWSVICNSPEAVRGATIFILGLFNLSHLLSVQLAVGFRWWWLYWRAELGLHRNGVGDSAASGSEAHRQRGQAFAAPCCSFSSSPGNGCGRDRDVYCW